MRLRTDGSVECWGRDDWDQTTDAPSGAFSQVSAGTYHSCGVQRGGGVVCWGGSNYGRTDAPSGNFSQVSAGIWHSCGVETDGDVSCWGSNLDGRRDAPSGAFSQVSAGWAHSCGVRTDGSLECWGLAPVPDPEPEPLLRALTVSPVDIPGFDADVTSYHVGVANSVTQVGITATATDAGSTIDIGGVSVSSGSSHSVSLTEGRKRSHHHGHRKRRSDCEDLYRRDRPRCDGPLRLEGRR